MTSRTGIGGFFAYAGIGFAVLGGIGMAVGGMGGAIAGGTFLMIGVIWAIVGFGLRAYYAGVKQKVEDEAQLFQAGTRATAVVEGAEVSATQINDCPVINLTLRVTPRQGPEFVHERRLAVPANGIPLPGHLVEVAFDPNDTSKVALETDARFASPPALYIKSRPPEQVAAPGAAAPATVIEQLERLQKLRESGALTESEFAAQKARILLEG